MEMIKLNLDFDRDYLSLFFAVVRGLRIPEARPDRVLHRGAT